MARVIVVGTDGSAIADRALDEAIAIAQRDQAALHVVTAFPDSGMLREQITSGATTVSVNVTEVADMVLSRAASRAAESGIQVETHSEQADPAEAIIDVADRVNADLIVVGSRGLSGVQRFVMGSVSTKVSQHAHANVMIVRD
jgi:nucleotide-binding universal stress UspA family protein